MDWKRFGREIGSYVIAGLIIVATAYIIGRLFTTEIPQSNRDIVMAAVGTILGWATAIVNFYFGSSKGSADKTDAMSQGK